MEERPPDAVLKRFSELPEPFLPFKQKTEYHQHVEQSSSSSDSEENPSESEDATETPKQSKLEAKYKKLRTLINSLLPLKALTDLAYAYSGAADDPTIRVSNKHVLSSLTKFIFSQPPTLQLQTSLEQYFLTVHKF